MTVEPCDVAEEVWTTVVVEPEPVEGVADAPVPRLTLTCLFSSLANAASTSPDGTADTEIMATSRSVEMDQLCMMQWGGGVESVEDRSCEADTIGWELVKDEVIKGGQERLVRIRRGCSTRVSRHRI